MRKGKTKFSMKKNVKRLLVFGLFSVAVICFVFVSVYKVINQIMEKYQEADELEKRIAALTLEEEELTNEITKLQDKDYLARYAREKYFYSKNGELIIRIPTEN
jgi:cell division protein DivIC